MAYLRTAALATAALGFAAGLGSPVTRAHAAVVCAATGTANPDLACFTGTDGDEFKLFEIKADGSRATFFNSIGSNTAVEDVKTVTDVPVDTSNGFGEVKPSKGSGPWTTTTFSPTATSAFTWDGLFVRGQIEGKSFDGDLFATVFLLNGTSASFEFSGIKSNADFGTLGFDEPPGSLGVAIRSATFSLAGTGGDFKSMKQFEVSECLTTAGCSGGGGEPPGSIPEPSTWAMMLLGFVGLGFAAFRRAKVRPVFMT